jgi:hypothetical protein
MFGCLVAVTLTEVQWLNNFLSRLSHMINIKEPRRKTNNIRHKIQRFEQCLMVDARCYDLQAKN